MSAALKLQIRIVSDAAPFLLLVDERLASRSSTSQKKMNNVNAAAFILETIDRYLDVLDWYLLKCTESFGNSSVTD